MLEHSSSELTLKQESVAAYWRYLEDVYDKYPDLEIPDITWLFVMAPVGNLRRGSMRVGALPHDQLLQLNVILNRDPSRKAKIMAELGTRGGGAEHYALYQALKSLEH